MFCNVPGSARLLVLTASMLGAACSAPMPQHHPATAVTTATASQESASPAASPPPPQVVIQVGSPPISQAVGHGDSPPEVVSLLAYADRIRGLSSSELSAELARLGEARNPNDQVQLALTLAQLRQTSELIRAQDLLHRLLANANPQATALHPLARLLAHRLGEQRRLEDLLDKQSQQTRDVQRRLEQTTERLQALKAIERSLGSPHSGSGRSPGVTAPSRPRPTP